MDNNLKYIRRITAGLLFSAACLMMAISCSRNQTGDIGGESFSFVFMTDLHIQPELHATEGVARAIDSVNNLKPDFVITGGDMIMDALRQTYGRSDSLYNLIGESLKKLQMPVHTTMGNHEVFGLYQTSGVDSTHELFGKKMYEKHFGETYYSFDFKNWHFIVLDGIGFTPGRHYFGYIDSLQLEWLKSDLLKAGAEKPIALSTHIPLLSTGAQIMASPTASFSQSEIITNAKDVLKILEPYNVKLVLQGHLHYLEDIWYEGTHFITGGAVCSNWWKGARYGMEEGFLAINVTGGEFSWRYVDFGWEPVQQ